MFGLLCPASHTTTFQQLEPRQCDRSRDRSPARAPALLSLASSRQHGICGLTSSHNTGTASGLPATLTLAFSFTGGDLASVFASSGSEARIKCSTSSVLACFPGLHPS